MGENIMKKVILFCAVGFLSGFINGFFGTGGAIPLLFLFAYLALPTDRAFATTGFCTMALSAVSFAFYMKNGVVKDSFIPQYFTSVMLPALVGGALGATLLSRLKSDILKKIFFAVTVVGGVGVIFK